MIPRWSTPAPPTWPTPPDGTPPDLLAGLDADRTAALAKGPWQAGLGISLVVAVGWFVLATANATTTFHLAPAVVAVAWPLGRRWRAGRPLPAITALTTALGGAVVAAATTLLLSVRGALAGPVLFGIPPLTETVLAAALGTVAGTALAMVGRRRRTG